eukprot:1258744-Rhodomonas_salina.1
MSENDGQCPRKRCAMSENHTSCWASRLKQSRQKPRRGQCCAMPTHALARSDKASGSFKRKLPQPVASSELVAGGMSAQAQATQQACLSACALRDLRN